ncbi:hypothetical protein C8J56DRAFT_1158172 [Mycena floridula]|nr:hypothetical protein C8J56DRAFT_1158172 [Mycena floridula]
MAASPRPPPSPTVSDNSSIRNQDDFSLSSHSSPSSTSSASVSFTLPSVAQSISSLSLATNSRPVSTPSPGIVQAEILLSSLSLEPGEIHEESPANASSDDGKVVDESINLPSAPTRQYIPLPEIEIHPASICIDPSSPCTTNTAALAAVDSRSSSHTQTPVPSPSSEAQASATDSSFKTPNVYINGLPPHYPEDQLFELTSPFGTIRSVRSFTRHVGEKESGYGFVLFETIEAAEKCIQSLRRFRNLHPTFSKQIHKIPGTPYVHAGQPGDSHGSTTSLDQDCLSEHPDSSVGDGSFKIKMERLHDPNSTNLYIEGLPLTIDEPSLAALVSPNRIKSSRFFQTRLSNPPRIIAFVRLETRAGAEEVIERLHGRMVRGWNDPGSRISVRFADTSEQRDLRRTERSLRDGDQSPARITIAQAALLNLHGRDQLESSPSFLPTSNSSPVISSLPSINLETLVRNESVDNGYLDFATNSASAPRYRDVGVVGGSLGQPIHQRAPQSYSPLAPPVSLPQNTDAPISPAMARLFDSLRVGAPPFIPGERQYENELQQNRLLLQQQQQKLQQLQLQQQQLEQLQMRNGLEDFGSHQNGLGGSQARGGYTPTEEYILQAHTSGNGQAQHRRPSRLDLGRPQPDAVDINMGVRGYRTQASTVAFNQRQQQQHPYQQRVSPMSRNIPLHPVEENQYNQPSYRPFNTPVRGAPSVVDASSHHASLSNRNPQLSQNQQAHIRSSTLPQSTTSTSVANSHHGNLSQQSRHYQHNSMSIPKSRHVATDIMRNSNIPPSSSHRSTTSISSITNNKNTKNHLYTSDMNGTIQYTNGPDSNNSNNFQLRHRSNSNQNNVDKTYDSLHVYSTYPDPDVYDVAQSSPPLVSPALTYSSRGSTATLSPATPFMGSFPRDDGYRAGDGVEISSGGR